MEVRARCALRFPIFYIIIALLLRSKLISGLGRPMGDKGFTIMSSKLQPSLVEDFLAHSDAHFHDIREPEAIRTALLHWYDENRRMLPWRGDPAPWCGSTATNPKVKKMHEFNEEDPNHRYPLTAYGVWVTEIMCQQTRVDAVIPYWLRWMKSFPTVYHLARATDDEVNAHWAGLGLYRRARLLHSAAKHVVEKLNGEIPRTVDELLQLSGVGRYTASAIASIAFNETVPVVDGNVCRVLSRLSLIANHIKAPELKDKWAWHLAQQIVEAGDGSRAGCVNSALMDLGATYCSPSGTGLEEGDPLKDFYLSTKLGDELIDALQRGQFQKYLDRADDLVADASPKCPVCSPSGTLHAVLSFGELYEQGRTKDTEVCGHAILPLAPPKLHKREEVYAVGALSCTTVKGDRRWLLIRRPSNGLLANQWEFPAAILWNSDEASANDEKKPRGRQDMSTQIPAFCKLVRMKALDSLLRDVRPADVSEHFSPFQAMKRIHVGERPIEHIFSHVRHTMWIEHAHMKAKPEVLEWIDANGRQVRWLNESDMGKVGVTSGMKKILKVLEKNPVALSTMPTTTAKRKR